MKDFIKTGFWVSSICTGMMLGNYLLSFIDRAMLNTVFGFWGTVMLWMFPYIVGGVIIGLYISHTKQQFYMVPAFFILGGIHLFFSDNDKKPYIISGIFYGLFIAAISCGITIKIRTIFKKMVTIDNINIRKSDK